MAANYLKYDSEDPDESKQTALRIGNIGNIGNTLKTAKLLLPYTKDFFWSTNNCIDEASTAFAKVIARGKLHFNADSNEVN